MIETLNFHEEDWERVQKDTLTWWEGDLPRPLVYLTATDPVKGPHTWGYHSNYGMDIPAAEIVDRYAPTLAAKKYYADAFPWLFINFGPGIIAGFLGSNVNSVTEPAETVWFSPATPLPAADLNLVYDAENSWWKRVKDLTNEMSSRFGGMLQVSHTDIGGNLDILASFLNTEQLLFDVVEQPKEVSRLINQITQLWIRYYGELDQIIRPTCPGTSAWTPIWSSGRTYMLQCDFAYMISPKMFERFVLPDLAACCDYLDHGFYHLDGKGQIGHLDHLLSITRLRGIQWIPGDGQPTPDQWLPLLKRIRDGGKLCQVFVSAEGALRIVRSLGGKGFLFVVSDDRNEFRSPDVAEAFLRQLAEEDISLA
jgi:hypothetical protein